MGWLTCNCLVASPGQRQASAQAEQQELVNKAETSFATFMRDPDMSWLQRHIGDAKAVLIAPQLVKAGFIFGGAGGPRGVVRA
jgi:lipid-binding SYLF domain-containing protein